MVSWVCGALENCWWIKVLMPLHFSMQTNEEDEYMNVQWLMCDIHQCIANWDQYKQGSNLQV